MKKRQTYSSSFKLEAVALVLEQDYTLKQACAALGVGETALRRWVNQYTQEQQGVTPVGYKALTSEQREIQALKKRVQRLEMEKDILKKATALLMVDEIKYTR